MRIKEFFKIKGGGIYEETNFPLYGKQDLGITPGGAADIFSMSIANILIGNSVNTPVLEMILPPVIEIKKDSLISLTGGKRKCILLKKSGKKEYPEQVKPFKVESGDIINFGELENGFRTYMAFKALNKSERIHLEGKKLNLSEYSDWIEIKKRIRVIKGPEQHILKDPELFFTNSWKTTLDMDNMGIRIKSEKELSFNKFNMVSEAVSDGTIQLTPSGPIILMRHRQTIGGYPRIYNIITADIDLLGQYGPDQSIFFKEVSQEEAVKVLKRKKTALKKIEDSIVKYSNLFSALS